MKQSIIGMRLKPHFLPIVGASLAFRCVTGIRTPSEKFWGWVYRDGKDRNKWTNSHDDGRFFATRTSAGRDLIERISR